MTKPLKKISLRAYAKSLGISNRAVGKAIASGKIKNGVCYITKTRKGIEFQCPVIIKAIANKEYGFIHKTGKLRPGQRNKKKHQKVLHDGKLNSADFDGCGLS